MHTFVILDINQWVTMREVICGIAWRCIIEKALNASLKKPSFYADTVYKYGSPEFVSADH